VFFGKYGILDYTLFRGDAMGTTWTKETILPLLANDRMLERSIIRIWHRQTTEEKLSQTTAQHNGMGFTAFDAAYLSSLAEWIQKGQTKGIPEGRRLSDKQKVIARRKMQKYAGQLAIVANEIAAAKLQKGA
jgi:hypothetical protein